MGKKITTYFDVNNPQHVEAYQYYLVHHHFPTAFFSGEVTEEDSNVLARQLAEEYVINFYRLHGKREVKVEKGIRPNSINFGFCRNERGEFEILDQEADTVRLIYRLYLQYSSLGKVVEYLNQHHIFPCRGKQWYPRSVYNILVNPIYIGKFRWRGKVVGGSHCALVNKNEFDRVFRILKRNKKGRI